jgi:hypothetical protein
MFIVVFILVFLVLSLFAGAVFVCSAGLGATVLVLLGLATLCVILYAGKCILLTGDGREGFLLLLFLLVILVFSWGYLWGFRFGLLETWFPHWNMTWDFSTTWAVWRPYRWWIGGAITLISFLAGLCGESEL